MSDFQIKKSPKIYDAIIVGSGAGGGMAAKVLTEGGLNVLLLEAGPTYDSAKGDMFRWNYSSPRMGATAGNKFNFGEFDAAWGGWQVEGEPYTVAKGTNFNWFRSRMLGGRTNHWGRISLRFGPRDFKHHSYDGLGDDWPISYEEVKPYYDQVDKLVGVFGTQENIFNEPDGLFLPPPKPRAYELLMKQACDKTGVKMIPSRMSMLTRPLGDRPPCHYCSQCGRGCSVYANFSSPPVLIRPALKTGKLELITGAMVREVLTDVHGLATGVSYVSTQDLKEYQVKAKVVVLAASACESARLLLNSKSSQFPAGLANSSGVIGKYLHDSTGSGRSAFVPKLMDLPKYNEDGIGGMHMYMPWWLDNKKLNFPRGYHIEPGGGRGMPGYGFGDGIEKVNGIILGGDSTIQKNGGGGYGRALKEDYRRFYGAYIGFAGRGESIARADNYCEIDPEKVDKFGIPVLRFHYTWSENEIQQVRHMHETFEEIISAMGGIPLGEKPTAAENYGIQTPGEIIHEVGTVRMGNDPKKSALNSFNQAHEVKNLFVVDGGAFVSQADKNPTWTILALSMRASEYILKETRKRNI